MRTIVDSLWDIGSVLWALLRAAIQNVRAHWLLALFSLLAAFGVWVLIQDIENPRAQGQVPFETAPAISVVALNVDEGGVLTGNLTVRVKVEARESDLPLLRPDDFRAEVDARGIVPGQSEFRTVRVTSRRSGVDVLEVVPPEVAVTVAPALVRNLPVQVRPVGELPSGYRLQEENAISVEPQQVRVRGAVEVMESIAFVGLEVNLTGVRDAEYRAEGELVALSESGSRLNVTITPARAEATIRIEQTISQRSVPITVQAVGDLPPGYHITNIKVNPPSVVVVGPKVFVDSLKEIAVERIDITGSRNDVQQIKRIDYPPNVTSDRQSVTVTIEIRPLEGSILLAVAPTFENAPTGLVPAAGAYVVSVRVTGPMPVLLALKPADVRATVSLAGAVQGTAQYTPAATLGATLPSGLRLEVIEPLSVRLVPVQP